MSFSELRRFQGAMGGVAIAYQLASQLLQTKAESYPRVTTVDATDDVDAMDLNVIDWPNILLASTAQLLPSLNFAPAGSDATARSTAAGNSDALSIQTLWITQPAAAPIVHLPYLLRYRRSPLGTVENPVSADVSILADAWQADQIMLAWLSMPPLSTGAPEEQLAALQHRLTAQTAPDVLNAMKSLLSQSLSGQSCSGQSFSEGAAVLEASQVKVCQALQRLEHWLQKPALAIAARRSARPSPNQAPTDSPAPSEQASQAPSEQASEQASEPITQPLLPVIWGLFYSLTTPKNPPLAVVRALRSKNSALTATLTGLFSGAQAGLAFNFTVEDPLKPLSNQLYADWAGIGTVPSTPQCQPVVQY
ncbi:MAG: hypothetical protein AAGF66_11565 [Cyanobacteria bacterium P01_H01_bin.119]